MPFTRASRWTTLALTQFLVLAGMMSFTDATLPIPFLGGNGTSLQTLQRDLTRASSFLTHYVNAHAQNTVTSLSQGRLPNLPITEMVIRQLSGVVGGAPSGQNLLGTLGGGSGSGGGATNSGGILGGLFNNIGGSSSSGNAPLPASGPVTVTIDDIRDRLRANVAAAAAQDAKKETGPVTVTLADLPVPAAEEVKKSGPVTVTLDDLAAALPGGDIGASLVTVTLAPDQSDVRGVREVGSVVPLAAASLLPLAAASDRSGDFTQ